MSMQGPDRSVSFEQDIKPLFRSTDRELMTFAFDLWDVSDVRSNADAILARLRAGTMPCDAPWRLAVREGRAVRPVDRDGRVRLMAEASG